MKTIVYPAGISTQILYVEHPENGLPNIPKELCIAAAAYVCLCLNTYAWSMLITAE